MDIVSKKPRRLSYDELHPFAKYKGSPLTFIVDPEGKLAKLTRLKANNSSMSTFQKKVMRRSRSQPIYNDLPAVRTLRSEAPPEVLAPPKIDYECTPIAVGDPIASPGTIYNVRYNGLLMNCLHHRERNGSWSGGGPLYIFKRVQTHSTMSGLRYFRNGVDLHCTIGGVSGVPMTKWGTNAVPGMSSWSTERAKAAQYYTKGYSRCRPGNPVASAFQFFYEGRQDGIPKLPGFTGSKTGKDTFQSLGRTVDAWKGGGLPQIMKRDRLFRDLPKALLANVSEFLIDPARAGDEFLNVKFGWAPIVSDLRRMYNLWKTMDKRLASLIKHNGRWQKRSCTLVDKTDVVTSQRNYPWAFANLQGAPPNWMDGLSAWTSVTRTTEKVWYTGAYYYYVPDIGSSQWTRRAKLTLFGALPTPEAVWSVVPWSWLIDWFSNVGDLMSNISPNAVDNCMLGRSFVMRHYTQETTCTVETWHTGIHTRSGNLGAEWDSFGGTFTSTEKIETKVRAGGCNPFGLDVGLSNLSNGQLGILAALGASRSRVRPSL